MYCVADDNPVSEYVVAVLPVLDTMVENAPLEVDLSISYPVTVPEGAVQERLICDVEVAVAVSPVGEPGGVGGGDGVNVVAEAVPDGELAPIPLIADTR